MQQFQGWSCSNHHLRTMDQWRLSSLTGDWSESSLTCITHILLPAEGQRERERERRNRCSGSYYLSRIWLVIYQLSLINTQWGWEELCTHSPNHNPSQTNYCHQMTPNHISPLKVVIIYSPSCPNLYVDFSMENKIAKISFSHIRILRDFFLRILWTKINKFTAVFKMYLYKEC